jgi:chromosome partitioning protein
MQTSQSVQDSTQAAATKAATKTINPYGAHQVAGNIIFATLCPDASTVQIAGDFNNWQPRRNPMKKVGDKGVWQLTLHLNPGTYRYRLVVDGKWQQDPFNGQAEPNPYGELNSVVTVK